MTKNRVTLDWKPISEKPGRSWEYLVCFEGGTIDILKYWTEDNEWTDRDHGEIDWDDYFAKPVGWCEMPYPSEKTIERIKHQMGMSV